VDEILARETSGGTVAWYLPDRLGTIRDLTDNTGAVIDHVDYTAYGSVVGETAPAVGDRFKFEGLDFDPASGLSLAVLRVEDPTSGRWLAQDPSGFASSDTNLYRYTLNSPTQYTDSLGLAPRPAPIDWNNPVFVTDPLEVPSPRLKGPIPPFTNPFWNCDQLLQKIIETSTSIYNRVVEVNTHITNGPGDKPWKQHIKDIVNHNLRVDQEIAWLNQLLEAYEVQQCHRKNPKTYPADPVPWPVPVRLPVPKAPPTSTPVTPAPPPKSFWDPLWEWLRDMPILISAR
jgi:RHS repeat-associated protein